MLMMRFSGGIQSTRSGKGKDLPRIFSFFCRIVAGASGIVVLPITSSFLLEHTEGNSITEHPKNHKIFKYVTSMTSLSIP